MRAHCFLCAGLLAACSTNPPAPPTTPEPPRSESVSAADDIVTLASGNDQSSTLVAALKAADLVETLQGDGPFTVFAPTDEAFQKLPVGTVESLLDPENRQRLIDVLTYHVVPGKVMSSQVVELDRATTVQGSDVSISTEGDSVRINGAKVIQADLAAKNGVIHVIDTVISPG